MGISDAGKAVAATSSGEDAEAAKVDVTASAATASGAEAEAAKVDAAAAATAATASGAEAAKVDAAAAVATISSVLNAAILELKEVVEMVFEMGKDWDTEDDGDIGRNVVVAEAEVHRQLEEDVGAEGYLGSEV